MKHHGWQALGVLGALGVLSAMGSLCALSLLSACGGGPGSPSATTARQALLPGAPTRLVATPGNASIALAFTAPASGGSAITQYRATCTAGAAVVTAWGAASPLTVEQLGNGTAYSCLVAASNAAGTGAASSSVRVTPANAWQTNDVSALRQKTGGRLSKIAG